jgi:hypothetical protein
MRLSLRRGALLVVVLAALWGLWEGWHWVGTHFALTWPFTVNDITMPHLHRIVQALFQPAQVNGPWLLQILWHASLFTAKESAVGLALGAVIGFVIAVVLSQSRLVERGFIPYIVASQTIPLLATNPAKLFGLYPRKGTIAVGSDADLVVFDPEKQVTLSAKTHHSKVDYNLFEGTQVIGSPDVVLLRGHVLVENDELVASPGIGQFVRRARFDAELKPARLAAAT